jgi:hypothetical protein
MINKVKLTLISVIAALGIALPAVAFAQSAYTTGTSAGGLMDSELAYGGHNFGRSSNSFSNEQKYNSFPNEQDYYARDAAVV